jgi:hypothetical protein
MKMAITAITQTNTVTRLGFIPLMPDPDIVALSLQKSPVGSSKSRPATRRREIGMI